MSRFNKYVEIIPDEEPYDDQARRSDIGLINYQPRVHRDDFTEFNGLFKVFKYITLIVSILLITGLIVSLLPKTRMAKQTLHSNRDGQPYSGDGVFSRTYDKSLPDMGLVQQKSNPNHAAKSVSSKNNSLPPMVEEPVKQIKEVDSNPVRDIHYQETIPKTLRQASNYSDRDVKKNYLDLHHEDEGMRTLIDAFESGNIERR